MTAGRLLEALTERYEDLRRRALDPVEVAILDSGIDATHPDLAGRVVAAYRVEEVEDGYRAVEVRAGGNADVFGHGTGVASIVARTAPNARLVDVRVLDADNLGAGRALLAGMAAAIERGSRVVNMSLAASSEFAPRLAALCEKAYRNDQVVVAARRNMPLADDGFPAELSSAISVDCERRDDPDSILFRRETTIEYAAHGEDVVVAAPGGAFTTKSGTSFATPLVSGLCALLLGAYPELEPFEVRTVLKALAE